MRNVVIASGLAAFVAGCSTPTPSNEPPAPVSSQEGAPRQGAAAPPAEPAGPSVVATFDGSFDAATKTLTISVRRASTGAIVTESLVYGTGAGDVYLHTEGTNGDGKSDPPVYDAATHLLTATVDAENGAGAILTGFTANFTSFAPSTVGMVTGGATTCTGAALGAGAQASPCAVAYGTVAPDPSFPTPVFTSAQPWTFYLPSGASFSFKGNVTGTLPSNGDAGAGHTGSSLVSGGVSATSPGYKMTMTTGQSPGGNATLKSPSWVMTGGVVGATQRP